MTPKEYIEQAMRTHHGTYPYDGYNEVTPQLEHAVMGVVTEAGEMMDAIKKAKIYGKDLDKVNMVEELGDIMWYLALMADDLGVSFEESWDKNIRKLAKRYPEKFTSDKALNRDLDAEREELEN